MKTVVTYLCGVLFLAGFAFGGVMMTRDLIRANASKHWPTVSGTVVSSMVEKRSHSGRNAGATYFGNVVYRYEVDGLSHTSLQVSYSDYGESGTGHARQIVSHYPPGRAVRVHYSPESPEVAVLEPGASVWSWIMPSVCLFISPIMPLVTVAGWLWLGLSVPGWGRRGSSASSRTPAPPVIDEFAASGRSGDTLPRSEPKTSGRLA